MPHSVSVFGSAGFTGALTARLLYRHPSLELKAVTARRTPWEALKHTFGVADSALRTLQTASAVLNDPRARGLVSTLADTRRRTGGDLLLAPVPRF